MLIQVFNTQATQRTYIIVARERGGEGRKESEKKKAQEMKHYLTSNARPNRKSPKGGALNTYTLLSFCECLSVVYYYRQLHYFPPTILSTNHTILFRPSTKLPQETNQPLNKVIPLGKDQYKKIYINKYCNEAVREREVP